MTDAIEQYENPFGVHVHKEKLVNISSSVALDGIAESILNMVDVGKSRMEDFRQKQLISKEISYHAPIKKNNYKSFYHAIQKIQITKIDGSVKIAEVDIFGPSNSYRLKTGKPLDFKKTMLYSLSPIPLSICNPNGSCQHTARSKLKDILLQDAEDHTNEGP